MLVMFVFVAYILLTPGPTSEGVYKQDLTLAQRIKERDYMPEHKFVVVRVDALAGTRIQRVIVSSDEKNVTPVLYVAEAAAEDQLKPGDAVHLTLVKFPEHYNHMDSSALLATRPIGEIVAR